MALKENYKDDILDTSQNVKRKYQMENNGDGTVSFTDVTEYTQEGDSFGSGDINATNGKVNTLDANLDGFKYYSTGKELVALVADDSFYTDENGKYVLADSPTGQTLLADTATYKALASTEDTRGEVGADTAIPFSGDKDWTLIIKVKGWYSSDMNGGDVTQNMKIQHINGVTSITEYASGRGPDRYSGSNTRNIWGGYNCEFVSFDYDD